jgi:uronate dehydrogenase
VTVTALITGGAGRIAREVRPYLVERGWTLRLLDVAPVPDDLEPGVEYLSASILDQDAVRRAAEGCDVVIHLGGWARERPWHDILELNIDGTRRVLEATREAGVTRILLASSIHAIGYLPADELGGTPLPRPDTYYGVSKAAVEALGALYADRFGMSVVSARIAAAQEHADSPLLRLFWCAPADSARLFAAAAALDEPGHHVVWGISRGAEGVVDLGPGRAIGFDPQEDGRLPDDAGFELPDPIGGEFADKPLGGIW